MSATSPTSTLQMCHDLVRFNRLFPQCCPDCYSSKWNCCEESESCSRCQMKRKRITLDLKKHYISEILPNLSGKEGQERPWA